MDAQQFLAEFGHIVSAPDGIAQLRSLILHMAVSGKLVPQRVEESAAKFLDQIVEKRDKQIGLGGIKGSKRMREEAIVAPWKIPSNWQWTRFAELCVFSAGRTPSRKEGKYWNTGDYPWFSIADLVHGAVIRQFSETISRTARDEVFKKAPVEAGTLLMSFKLSIGKLAVLGVDGYHNEAIIAIYPYHEVLKDYFFKCLNGFDLMAGNKAAIKGNTLNQNSISNILVALPPEEEIPRIVAKVDELMALCDKLEAQQQAKRTLQNNLRLASLQAVAGATSPNELNSTSRKAFANFSNLFSKAEDVLELRNLVLDLAVHGLLVEQDPSEEHAEQWLARVREHKLGLLKAKLIAKQTPLPLIAEEEYPFSLPRGWTFVRLGEICNKIGSGSTPRGGREVYVKEGVPFLRSQNIWNDGLKLNDVAFITDEEHERMSNTSVQANDILLNITGASLGRSALVPDDFSEANVSQHVTIIRLTDPEVRLYLHLCILSPYTQAMIWGRQVGMAREGLSKKVLEQFEIPLPPLAEQKRIVKRVAELMRLCDRLENQFHASDNLAQQLAVTSVAAITGVRTEEEEELKAPKTELISKLRLANSPDIKEQAPLAAILARHHDEMSASDLWQRYGGEIDAFYAQLKLEVDKGWIEEPSVAEVREVEEG